MEESKADSEINNLSKAVSEAEHYLMMGVEKFSVMVGDIEIRRIKEVKDGYHPTVLRDSNLTGLEIASEDYWEYSDEDSSAVVDGKKRYFTFDEALEIEKKVGDGWRLPTRHECVLLTEEFGTEENYGKFSPDRLEYELGLHKMGYVGGSSLYNFRAYANYWSSTVYSSDNSYRLGYTSANVYPANRYYRNYGFSVRLVREKEQ